MGKFEFILDRQSHSTDCVQRVYVEERMVGDQRAVVNVAKTQCELQEHDNPIPCVV